MASRSYSLHEPKQHVVELYVKNMKLKVLKNGSLANDLFSAFQASAMKSFGEKRKSKKLTNAVCNIAVRKVVCKALQKRKESVGHFLASVLKVNALQISVDDFGDCFHTASSEPYFYDQSYANGQTRKATISVDEEGMHVIEREVWVQEPRNTPIPVHEQGRCSCTGNHWRVQGGAPGARAPPSPWPWHCVMINLMVRRLFLAYIRRLKSQWILGSSAMESICLAWFSYHLTDCFITSK